VPPRLAALLLFVNFAILLTICQVTVGLLSTLVAASP
jgi:hypothetical protein